MVSEEVGMNSGRRLFIKRTTSAIVWTVIFEIFAACLFLSVLQFNLLKPLSWFVDALSVLICLKTWVLFVPVIISTFVFGVLYCNEFTTVPPHFSSRIGYLRYMITVRNGFLAVVLMLFGGLFAWFYLTLSGGRYSSMSNKCSNSVGDCLVESKFYLILSQMFIALSFLFSECVYDINFLQYPVVQQFKLLQIIAEFPRLFAQSFVKAIWPVVLFPVIYFWKGVVLRDHFIDVLGFAPAASTSFENLSFYLFFINWMLASLFIFTLLTAKFLINLHLTERHVFPINTDDGADTLKLSEAMSLKEFPCIQNLGYLDFLLLAVKDFARRQQLFVLSQPGGHPYNWNSVISVCLKSIGLYTEQLNLACFQENSGKTSPKDDSVCFSEQPAPVHSKSYNTSIRNLTLQKVMDDNDPPPAVTQESMLDMFKTQWNQVLYFISRLSAASYLFGFLPESKTQWVLLQAQPIIWGTQGMAYITAASFKEDSFGISLKDLPAIITSLVNLNRALLKLPKLATHKRSLRSEIHCIKLKRELKCAVERSLYRICLTYAAYLKDINVSNDVSQELQNFVMCMDLKR